MTSINTVMTPENFIDVTHARADAIAAGLPSDMPIHLATTLGRNNACQVIKGIVKQYNDKPHQANEAFKHTITAWEESRKYAYGKQESKLLFAKMQGTDSSELEKKMRVLEAFFGAGLKLTRKVMTDLIDEFDPTDREENGIKLDGTKEGEA